MSRRYVVHYRRAHSGNFVGGNGNSYSRTTNRHPEVRLPRSHASPDGGTKVGVVNRNLGVISTQVDDVVAPFAESERERGF
jgi:hypothetical protein